MARVNVYLPDDLAAKAKDAGLNVSSLTQEALRNELAKHELSAWLERVRRERPMPGVSHEAVIAALDAVRAEAGDVLPGGAEPGER